MGRGRWSWESGTSAANQCFGHVKFAIPFRHRNGKVREAVGYTIPELRGMLKAEM